MVHFKNGICKLTGVKHPGCFDKKVMDKETLAKR